ncbi:DHA2 family efflux MFS transporter permease subunit [Actinomadura darangshiensis]|uniref:DHA2 family efflux MFS transporter permease subunit n=1 Tax=Actinomadura darangshiensis TaxID=705336 RepID=A0A4R5BI98_9ACTN|nr:DHA2 family efflux MFS transporter permease subunit [Actinomadura darangshiensis]TDD85249.1 DHA2 family efflux MFS transporter permease subunit [Actinomadura darangshiensis]
MTVGYRRRWFGLGALALSMLALGFDMTILNVALTTLSGELHAGTSALQWIVDSYLLVFGALLLPAGLLGDRFGRKWLLLTGLGIFGLASLAGAFAGGTGGVIAARLFMGLGAAIVMPLSMSMLPAIFPPHERTRAVAVWSASTALGLPLGPLLGGWLLQNFWWGSIFLINVPVVVIGGIAVAFLLPETRDPAAPRVDLSGSLLSMAGLVALVYGVIEAPARGWTDPVVLGCFVLAVALLAAFVRWERRAADPMLPMALFRDRAFVWAMVAAVTANLMMGGILFVLPQYLEAVQGSDVFDTGLKLIPMLLGLLAGGVATDRAAPRTGHKPIMVLGLLVLAAGLGWGALTGAGDGYAATVPWLVVVGVGSGLTLIPAMDAVLAALPADQAGRGSGLVQTLRQTGGTLGVAGLGSLLAGIYRDRVDTGGLPAGAAGAARDSIGGAVAAAGRLEDGGLLASARDAYVHGMDAVLGACAAAALAVAVLLWLFQPGREPEGAAPAVDEPESDHEHVVP